MSFPKLKTNNDKVNSFVNELAPYVVFNFMKYYNQQLKVVYPSTVLAVAALESGWNINATSLFGIKGNGVTADTQEFINNEYVDITAEFQYYPNVEAAVTGFYDLMQWEHYDSVTVCMDYASECKQLQACGYATDPQYSEKLINIIETFDLSNFDYYINELVQATKFATDINKEVYNTYVVQAGDNLWNIAANLYELTDDTDISYRVDELTKINHLSNPSLIYEGQIILY